MIHIPTLFENIVAKVDAELNTGTSPKRVYFDYGHYVDVTRNLGDKDKSISQKGDKYPLIWLVMDFEERFGGEEYEYCELPDLQFIIAVPTKPAINARKRTEETFTPTLYPIYEEFKKQIAYSGYFGNAEPLEHTKIDRPYWGGQDGLGNGQANLFNDFIDAIQLKRVRLNVNNIC